MAESAPLLEVSNLSVSLQQGNTQAALPIIDGVSFCLQKGEILGIVGESGSGKTMTCSALLRLLPAAAKVTADKLRLAELDLLSCPAAAVRGKRVSMIFQDPAAALNPVFSIRSQIDAVIKRHTQLGRASRKTAVLDALHEVGLPDVSRVAASYPHELSGGMQQRVMIAMALAAGAELLIADEPTTALDVSVQAKILELLESLRSRRGLSIIFISHDLAVVSQICDRVAVMFKGGFIETGSVSGVVRSPQHGYTRALLNASPGLHPKGEPLPVLSHSFAGVESDAN